MRGEKEETGEREEELLQTKSLLTGYLLVGGQVVGMWTGQFFNFNLDLFV